MKNLIENALPFYQSEAREVEKDEKTLEFYDEAVNEAERWLEGVLRRDILENGYDEVSAVLHLPLGDVSVEEDISLTRDVNPFLTRSACGGKPEVFHTPIGVFDLYTYNAIVWESGNPVRELFEYFDGIIITMRGTLAFALDERNQHLITSELLREYKWYDVLGLHRMMYGSLDEILPKL